MAHQKAHQGSFLKHTSRQWPALIMACLCTAGACAATLDVQVKNFEFSPSTVNVKEGDTVRWTFLAAGHTVTSGSNCSADGLLDAAGEPGSSPVSFTFTKVGTFRYFCRPHCSFGMTGTVNVEAKNSGGGQALANPIPASIPTGDLSVKLTQVATGLTAPNWGTTAPGQDGRLFITDQPGKIWVVELSTGAVTEFADLGSLLVPMGAFSPGGYDERGLLGLAFHPDYAANGLFYTYTSEPVRGTADFTTLPIGVPADHQSIIREWKVPNPGNPESKPGMDASRVVLSLAEPQFNHNGGGLAFGKDGNLYISTGDGGNADDQGVGHGDSGNGQDLGNLLGKILRINPLLRNAPNGQYGVPGNNPFASRKGQRGGQAGCADGRCDEIYAWGFRNPFRLSFDRKSRALWIADVGQNSVEEVDKVRRGGNYGWPLKEGSFCFDNNGPGNGFVTDAAVCGASSKATIDPMVQYDHDEGKAIIGGFVYRGKAIPALRGRYVFADYARTFQSDGRLFYSKGRKGPWEFRLAGDTKVGIAVMGMGQDAAGELYVLGNTTGVPSGNTGVVLKISP